MSESERGPSANTGEPDPSGHRGPTGRRSPWSRLWRSLAPRATRSQVLAAILSAVVGFALVVQLTQNQSDDLSNLRQSDLVRLLDEVTQRSEALTAERSRLEDQVTELESGSDSSKAALRAAKQAAETQGILSGRLPAQGPGIALVISGETDAVVAADLLNVLEELRNAGAEAIEINKQRVIVSTSFVDTADGVVMDGTLLVAPYRWLVVGEPSTLQPALEIPGGALAVLRNAGAAATVVPGDEIEILATTVPRTPEYVTAVPTS